MYFFLIYLLIFIIPFLVMPRPMMVGNVSPYSIVVRSTLTISAGALVMFMMAYLSGEGVYSQLLDTVSNLPEGIDPVFTEVYIESLDTIPMSIMFMGAIVSYWIYMLLARSLGKRGPVKKMPKFRELSFPSSAGTGIIIMYFVAWLILNSETDASEMLFVNINLLFDLVFSIQGVAVVLTMFYLKRLPGVVGWIAALALWITSIGRMGLVFLGMFDMFFNVRTRVKPRVVKRK